MNLIIYMVDFPDVIFKIQNEILSRSKIPLHKVFLVEGIFPFEASIDLNKLIFDRIDVYSVIHYTDQPIVVIDAAVSMLAPGGRLLIGDIPNINRKGRFLASDFGRAFEARYRNIPLEEVPIYANHQEFAMHAIESGFPSLDDNFIFSALKRYRDLGLDAFVLHQPLSLPFSMTREDMLICRPHD